jgi:uncharacterized repeat protein (TIGR03806 family)
MIPYFPLHRRIGALLIVAFGLIVACGLARADAPIAECRWTDHPPVIDGRGTDAAWQHAQPIELQIAWNRANPKPRAKTTARLLWDRENLYFFSEMEDASIVATVKEHNGNLWEGDVFELFLKPSTEHGGYYEFEVNPLNAVLDCFFPHREPLGFVRWRNVWKFHLQTKVDIHTGGWSVEGKMPWSDLAPTGGRPAPAEEWRFTFCRYDYTPNAQAEPSASAPLTAASFHRTEDYAPLRFIGPEKSPRTLWKTSRVVGSPGPATGYRVERVYPHLKGKGFTAICTEPGSDRLLYLEHTHGWGGGMQLKRFRDDPAVTDSELLMDMPDAAYGFAFHPDFAHNRYVYLGCNGPADKAPRFSRIVRYTIGREAPWRFEPDSRKVIIEWPSDGHNGADMCSGENGLLYITSGDGTSDSDGDNAGQSTASLRSKVLRIDVEHPAPGRAYSVPADNPFINRKDFAPETWAYGLRNPWRITYDRQSSQLWVGENGQDAWESARLIERGANYGWSVYEGSHPFRLDRKLGPDPLTPPTIEHPHAEFRSLTGGLVYRGDAFPELRGAYLYGDYGTGRIWAAKHDGHRLLWNKELAHSALAVTGFGLDPRGEPVIADYNGGFYRIVRDAIDPSTAPKFPEKLSQTGLFIDTAALTPDPALIAYSVNTPLWSDGAEKERFIALPGDARMEWRGPAGWNLPDGAVLVKTFFFNGAADTRPTRKRIETRLLTRQQGDWLGYTYIWNDAQTDAVLAPRGGEDREIAVGDQAATGGVRTQRWHFPSRAECMACHTRAANFVLGLNEGQLNKPHDYGHGVVENQLTHLERLGVLKVNAAQDSTERRGREGTAEKAPAASEDPQRSAPAESDWLLPCEPDRMARYASLEDPHATLEHRARSYLAANCAMCHVYTGGGNSAIDLDYNTKSASMQAIGVAPMHGTLGVTGGLLIAPGDPDRSVLLYRMNHRGPGQMPPLASSAVDEKAVKLLREWIATMPAK